MAEINGPEYQRNRPIELGPLNSEEIRENFRALSRFNELRVVPLDTDVPTVRINGGTTVMGDRLVEVDEQVIEYDGNQHELPNPNLCSQRTDLVVVNRYGHVEVVKGEPGGDTPALPKGVFSCGLLHLKPDMSTIEYDQVTDTRMYNVAGTDVWWESGPTFQRGTKQYDDSSDKQLLPDGINYDPGTGNLVVFYGGEIKHPGVDYEATKPSEIKWIDGKEPSNGQSVEFIRMSGDGTTRFFSDRDDKSFVDNPVQLNFFYKVGSGSLSVYHKGRLRTEGVHYEEVGNQSDSSRKVKFKSGNIPAPGDNITFVKSATYPDYRHGYEHVTGEDPVPQLTVDHSSVDPLNVETFYEAIADGGHSTLEMKVDRQNNIFSIHSFSRANFGRKVRSKITFYGTNVQSVSGQDDYWVDGNEVEILQSTGGGSDLIEIQLSNISDNVHWELEILDLKITSSQDPETTTVLDMITYGDSVLRRNLYADEPADEHMIFRSALIPNLEREALQDEVARLIHDSDSIWYSYDDPDNELRLHLNIENFQDEIASFLKNSDSISIDYNDSNDELKFRIIDEWLEDHVAGFVRDSRNIEFNYFDGDNALEADFNQARSDYYVDGSGSNNNDGTSASPWKTLDYALRQIPQVLNREITIHLSGNFNYDPALHTALNSFDSTGNGRINFVGNSHNSDRIIGDSNESFVLNNTIPMTFHEVEIEQFGSPSVFLKNMDVVEFITSQIDHTDGTWIEAINCGSVIFSDRFNFENPLEAPRIKGFNSRFIVHNPSQNHVDFVVEGTDHNVEINLSGDSSVLTEWKGDTTTLALSDNKNGNSEFEFNLDDNSYIDDSTNISD